MKSYTTSSYTGIFETDISRRKWEPTNRAFKHLVYFNGRCTDQYRAEFKEYKLLTNSRRDIITNLDKFNGVTNIQINGLTIKTIQELKLATLLIG